MTARSDPAPGGIERRGFVPPPYPYTRLDALRTLADACEGGMVDCSIGTPCDPPPPAVVSALATSGSEGGYPPSAGTAALRKAASAWLSETFSVSIDADAVAACVGTKEMVASSAHYLALREPDRDTVLYPSVAYPTYEMSALLAGCRAVPVPPAAPDGTGLTLDALDPDDVRRALMLWANSPANPSGGMTDLDRVADWGRSHRVPVFSDECYAPFTWCGPPRSILESGTAGVVAVHSLSKRSNLAGVRVGFFAGDRGLVSYLREVRQHAGLMVPGPVQAAAVEALGDESHVLEQRARYRERLELIAAALRAIGCPVELPAGGFYLWPAVPRRWPDGWAMAEDLARVGGLLVSPGDLYGSDGAGHVRIAVVQPVERLELVASRLESSNWQ